MESRHGQSCLTGKTGKQLKTDASAYSLSSARNSEILLYVSLGLLCVVIGISLGLSNRAAFTIGSIAILAFLLIFFVVQAKGIGDNTFIDFLLAALVIRILIAVVLHNTTIIHEADAIQYHAEASRLSLALLGTGSLTSTGAVYASGYVYFNSFLFNNII